MGIFDEPEFKCAAGVGLSALGIGGLGVPLAVDSCPDAVEKIEERAEKLATKAYDQASEAICYATDPATLLFGSVLSFGPATGLTMRYFPSVCESKGQDFLDTVKDTALEFLPLAFGGLVGGGVAAYLLADQISDRGVEDTMKDLARGLTAALLSGVAMAGAGKALKSVTKAGFAEEFLQSAQRYETMTRNYHNFNRTTNGELTKRLQELKLKEMNKSK